MEYVNLQIGSCLLLLIVGMILGGFFDLYRVFRGSIRVNKFLDYLGDLLFWIATASLITPLLYWSTWLELRFYVWLALAFGLSGYYFFLSAALLPLFIKFWQLIFWTPRLLLKRMHRVGLSVKKSFWRFQSRPRETNRPHKKGGQ